MAHFSQLPIRQFTELIGALELFQLALGITTVRACGIGRAVFRYGERYLSHRMAFRILTEIRTSFYDRAAKVLPLRSGPARQGEFLHDLLTGADELRDFYVRALLPIAAIGTINLVVSFSLALNVALRSRQVSGTPWKTIIGAVWRHLRQRPRDFFMPPKNNIAEIR